MLINTLKNKQLSIFVFIQAIISLIVILNFDGTGDSGDSIMHYLFAKYSFQHPELFFDHWAKPIFVLLASPFAQFGFIGMKFFNTIVMLLTVFFTFKTTEKLNIKNPIISAIFLFCSPLVFVLTFSGLTEHLFSLFLIISIYLLLLKKPIASCLIISFLPFIRSEGLIFIGIVSVYLLTQKKWKIIPLLLFGHLVYSIAGYHFYNDFLWVFNKIPYLKLSSTYSSLYSTNGRLFHFVKQMNYVVGIPIYILFWIGTISVIYNLIKKKISNELLILVVFSFFAFFFAHTLFWYFGIFNSMGLKRVLVSVAPLASIISLLGFNFIINFFDNKSSLKSVLKTGIIICIILFPFSSNPAAINWNKELSLTTDQKLAQKISYLISTLIDSNSRIAYAHPYLNEVLKIDCFDKKKKHDINEEFFSQIKKGDIIIWDIGFAVVEQGINKDYLENIKHLKLLFNLSENKNSEVYFSVYQYQ